VRDQERPEGSGVVQREAEKSAVGLRMRVRCRRIQPGVGAGHRQASPKFIPDRHGVNLCADERPWQVEGWPDWSHRDR
jgi:hypothetical protein